MLLCKMRKLFCLCLRLVTTWSHAQTTLSPPTILSLHPQVHFLFRLFTFPLSARASLQTNCAIGFPSLPLLQTKHSRTCWDQKTLVIVLWFTCFLAASDTKCGVPAVDICLGIDGWTVNTREVDSWTLGQWRPESGNRPRFLRTDTKQSWKYPAVDQRSGT